MTRINKHIKPIHLLDQHLTAEYREIVRIPNQVKKDAQKTLNALKKAPSEFKLGKGHVLFFYDKCKYLHDRYLDLKSEMDNRHIENNMSDEMFSNIPSYFYNDYQNDNNHTDIINRILERAKTMKILRYYKKEISFDEYQKILLDNYF